MIALRARREAYRIASDLMHPHVDVPPPPAPTLPVVMIPEPGTRLAYCPPTPRQMAMRKIALLVWLLVILVLGIEAAVYG